MQVCLHYCCTACCTNIRASRRFRISNALSRASRNNSSREAERLGPIRNVFRRARASGPLAIPAAINLRLEGLGLIHTYSNLYAQKLLHQHNKGDGGCACSLRRCLIDSLAGVLPRPCRRGKNCAIYARITATPRYCSAEIDA